MSISWPKRGRGGVLLRSEVESMAWLQRSTLAANYALKEMDFVIGSGWWTACYKDWTSVNLVVELNLIEIIKK